MQRLASKCKRSGRLAAWPLTLALLGGPALFGFLFCGLLLAAETAAAPLSEVAVQPLAVEQLRPGVYVHVGLIDDWLPANGGDIANLAFVVGSRCVAVIDTGGTPQIGQRLRAAIERTTPLPVCYVINSHAHPDHVLGNSAFVGGSGGPAAMAGAAASGGPAFVAHARLAAALAARGPYYLHALQRDFGLPAPPSTLVYPTRGVDVGAAAAVELDLGGRVLQLNAWPTAHTDNDLTVYDRATRTLFLSDLLFARHMPVIDGSLRGWLQVLQELTAFDVALAVPGHGPVSTDWPAALAPETNYLQAVLRETRQAIKNRVTIRDAVDQVAASETARWQLSAQFHRRNVTAAYAELEWEE